MKKLLTIGALACCKGYPTADKAIAVHHFRSQCRARVAVQWLSAQSETLGQRDN